ncbi:hypothetical protein A3B45_00130 [Candidatus Daviesbacteria bacterium RIFCSPLOWO2_01_FULL_39_12]|uniref:DUF4012 domain-containing protein n=1 Tax=Candidatus Daviesbacteria bacterium RIFCSPLOWO2_01_FULL_39_12 TaxID=1797785 RepID=A0A1F5KP40_9BACT|nr:MAG: hypothetical protein A3D79_02560 [Candidatus Daviesbacteria bacterium RIFCSPHIGHO2_02_FULL_39_8]OGE42604.1 MAG: hypothetical protein A3B45_00130 [Candidatus Daviesbacteria bacterium RIFCSPLOWO2_01_FULL_39_12]
MALFNLTKELDKYDKSHIKRRPKKGRFFKRLFIIFLVVFLLTAIPLVFVYTGVRDLNAHGKALIKAYEAQNYETVQKELSSTKSALQKVNFPLSFLFWLKFIPFLGGYYQDIKGFTQAGVYELEALVTLFTKLESQKEELGFNNTPKGGSERIVQSIRILEKLQPYLDDIESKLTKAADEVEGIDTKKYPEKIRGISIRKNLEVLRNFMIGAGVAVMEGRTALEVAPQALGVPNKKNYLLLFQNDKEIRPTGGFITAFATLSIDNGQISPTNSDDIYRLDEKLLNVCLTKICPLAPPEPLVKYLPETTGKVRSAWSMRDSNISPHLPTAAKEFERMYQLLGEGLPFDGIIYIDTQVVEELIEVTGPIDVFGTKYSAELDKRCNCPNVIYELESYAEIAAKGEKDRKAILGVLMQQILTKTLEAEISRLPQFAQAVARLANHKHIMFYMHDKKVQEGLSELNWTGQIKDYDGDLPAGPQDYLHINDANFAGGKTNLYVEQTVTQEINIKNGKITKKVIIDYSNPQQFNKWLNGINRDYVRIYVPKGSKLISSKGSEDQVNTIEDLGKTVFETFITVRPQNSRKLEIEYEVAYKPEGEYKLLIQKQPGAKDFKYKIKLNGSQKADFKLEQDREFKFDL